jgi:2-haloacid dehalogenase
MNDRTIAVDALVFDAYGTLFDVNAIGARAEELLPGHGAVLSRLWRTKQLEYTWLQSLMGPSIRQDFEVVTAHALDYALAELGLPLAAGERRSLRDAYVTLTPFPDAPRTLAALAPRPRWILSNGTPAMLEPLVRHHHLDAHVDGILSVEAAGIYKPSPRVYQLAVDRIGVVAARIGFVSANGWDAIGAKAFGFVSFWINRAGAPVDRHGPAPDRIIASLAELPALLA